ncbi:MAG TPA: Spy/CpxP family protein refolding chaperone [Coleofasciculaceae cyanobacterium]
MVKLNDRLHSLALGVVMLTSLGLPMALAEKQSATGTENPAQNQEQGHKEGWHHGQKHPCNMKQSLNLSDEQKQQMKTLNQTFRQENAAIIESLKAKHQQLKELGKGDETKEQRQQLMQALRQERETLHTKRMALMKQVLTDEQMNQFQSAREQCKAQHQHKKGEGAQNAAPGTQPQN